MTVLLLAFCITCLSFTVYHLPPFFPVQFLIVLIVSDLNKIDHGLASVLTHGRIYKSSHSNHELIKLYFTSFAFSIRAKGNLLSVNVLLFDNLSILLICQNESRYSTEYIGCYTFHNTIILKVLTKRSFTL